MSGRNAKLIKAMSATRGSVFRQRAADRCGRRGVGRRLRAGTAVLPSRAIIVTGGIKPE